jgi:hypothetical protein
LVAAFTDEIGGDLSTSEQALVKQAAGLTLRGEQLQAAIVRGEAIDDDLLVRLAGAARRVLGAIGVKASERKPAPMSLAEYAARRIEEHDDGE